MCVSILELGGVEKEVGVVGVESMGSLEISKRLKKWLHLLHYCVHSVALKA